MALAAIEIHDAGIVAVREGAPRPLADSPGYAVLDGKEMLTGEAALRKSRLLPRHCYTRFWDRLDRSPLPRPFPSKLTRADLAHGHLSSVWKLAGRGVDRAVLVVPGWFADGELGLLLGIARSCAIPVTGMVDLALAAALEGDAEPAVFLDLHLHRAAAAGIARNGGIRRGKVVSDEGVGRVALETAFADFVSQKFVRETRFDPLHEATTEQALYDRLPPLLEALREREGAVIALETAQKQHEVEVTRNELVATGLPYYRRLLDLARSLDPSESWPRVLLSSRAADLPGLAGLLEREVSPLVTILPPGAAARNTLAHALRIPRASTTDGSIPFVASLGPDARERPSALPPEGGGPSPEGDRLPTHVLHEGVAHPIEPSPFFIGVEIPEGRRGLALSGASGGISRHHCALSRVDGRIVVEDHSRYGCFLNGERVAGKTPVRPGDRLRLGTSDIEVLLIEVKR